LEQTQSHGRVQQCHSPVYAPMLNLTSPSIPGPAELGPDVPVPASTSAEPSALSPQPEAPQGETVWATSRQVGVNRAFAGPDWPRLVACYPSLCHAWPSAWSVSAATLCSTGRGPIPRHARMLGGCSSVHTDMEAKLLQLPEIHLGGDQVLA
jgi:hypothetical protein